MIIIAAVGLGSFYGGIQFQKSKLPNIEIGQFPGRGNTTNSTSGRERGRSGSQPVSGEIISVDDTGITVKTHNRSSKIVLVSSTTEVNKAVTGSKSDLTIGANVMVIGTSDSKGIVSAQNITLGEAQFGMPPGGGDPSYPNQTPIN